MDRFVYTYLYQSIVCYEYKLPPLILYIDYIYIESCTAAAAVLAIESRFAFVCDIAVVLPSNNCGHFV